MAKANPRLNSFDQVTALYDSIKPMRGKLKDQDVRPIGDRRRKWERIVKISDDCYLLFDGNGAGDNIDFWTYSTPNQVSRAEMIELAPVKWERDGADEYVTLRNGSGLNWTHSGRYDFLARTCPRSMGVAVTGGKQFVHNRVFDGEDKHYLPKSAYFPNAKTNWGQYMDGPAEDDHVYLRFKRDGWNIFKLVSPAFPEPTIRVDKERKAKWKPKLNALYEYACVMTPMLPLGDSTWLNNMKREQGKHFGEADIDGWAITPLDALEAGEGDVGFHHLALEFAVSTETYEWGVGTTFKIQTVRTKEDASGVRSSFNRWANKMFGFNYNTTKE